VSSSRAFYEKIQLRKASDGVKATLIDQITQPAGPWQVRLMPEGASAVTME